MFPAERIELLREERGITQKQLAAKIHVSSSSISEYEKGNIQPSTTVLLALADFFHVNLDYLLGRTSIRNTHKPFRGRSNYQIWKNTDRYFISIKQ